MEDLRNVGRETCHCFFLTWRSTNAPVVKNRWVFTSDMIIEMSSSRDRSYFCSEISKLWRSFCAVTEHLSNRNHPSGDREVRARPRRHVMVIKPWSRHSREHDNVMRSWKKVVLLTRRSRTSSVAHSTQIHLNNTHLKKEIFQSTNRHSQKRQKASLSGKSTIKCETEVMRPRKCIPVDPVLRFHQSHLCLSTLTLGCACVKFASVKSLMRVSRNAFVVTGCRWWQVWDQQKGLSNRGQTPWTLNFEPQTLNRKPSRAKRHNCVNSAPSRFAPPAKSQTVAWPPNVNTVV